MKRITMAGLPHHVIQRGQHGRQTFLNNDDYATYLEILAECCLCHAIDIWAYCLMPDHVHLIAVPREDNALSKGLRVVHSRYTKYMNKKTGNSGQFWQGRFSSHLLDEQYLIACARYIEINPVKRGYVDQPEDWPWSSARAHVLKIRNPLVQIEPLLKRVDMKWQDYLARPRPAAEADLFYLHEKNGLPLGNDDFLTMVQERR